MLDPNKRISAHKALDADYFWEEPMPCEPRELPKYEPSHEFQTKKRLQEMKRTLESKKRPRHERSDQDK